MNVKVSVFVISVEAIIYLLLYNLHDYTFNIVSSLKNKKMELLKPPQEELHEFPEML